MCNLHLSPTTNHHSDSVIIPFRRNEEQLRKVQERQALLLKKKEVQKIQMQQKMAVTDVPEQVKMRIMEKHHEIPKYEDPGKKLNENFQIATWESDEEHYREEENRKLDNFNSHEDYNCYVEKQMEEADLAKIRMCSIDKIPTINDQDYTCKHSVMSMDDFLHCLKFFYTFLLSF